MKTLRLMVSYLLIISMFVLTMPLTPKAIPVNAAGMLKQGRGIKEFKVKRGPEVAERVKKLKEKNKAVRRALGTFEQNKHAPKIDESYAISGTFESSVSTQIENHSVRGLFRKANFKLQDVVSGDGAELILVPTLSTDTEWQGTVIATSYDEQGNFLEQYVADAVLVRQNDDIQPWRDIYEVSFDGSNAWLESDPNMGMITDPSLEFGRTIYEQPDLQGVQFEQQISLLSGAKFRNINFQIRSDRNFYPPPSPPSDREPNPRFGAYIGAVALGAVASAARCWIAGPFTLPCIAGGTVAAAIMALPLLFGSRPRTQRTQ